jgi:hypothetical protein
MPKKKQSDSLRTAAPRAPSAPGADALLTTTRIDPPHVLAGSTGDAEEALPQGPIALSALASAAASPAVPPVNLAASEIPAWQFAAASPDGIAFEQMQNQAAQLAAQLAKQQMALDHREAEINARAAAVESQVRTARLWLSEKLEMLARSKGEAAWVNDETLARLAAGARSLHPAGPSATGLDDPAIPLSHAAESWRHQRWQEQFEQWRGERQAAAEAETPGSPETAMEQADSSAQPPAVPIYRRKEAEERLQATEQRLAARAAELEAKRVELLADRRALETEREAFHVEKQQERWRLAEQRRTMSEKLMRQRARLRRRRDDFDARETALRQLRADLLRAQQQTLEMRLAAEELWARLRGKGAAADASSLRSGPRDAADEQQMGAA